MNNWVHSYLKLNKIIDAWIPYQCEKILGGDIDEACNIFKHIETESDFLSLNDLKENLRACSYSFFLYINLLVISTSQLTLMVLLYVLLV